MAGQRKKVKTARLPRLYGAAAMICGCMLAALGCDHETRSVARSIEVPVESGIEIQTAQQLADIGIVEEYPADGEYYLSGDIDLSPLWEDDPEYIWWGIGSTCKECGGPLLPVDKMTHTLPLRCENRDCSLYLETQQPFSGVLHGNGYTIKGLKLPAESAGGGASTGYEEALYFGLFGYINTAYIHDLTVEVANTEDERAAYSGTDVSTVNMKPSFGALAGVARGSRIENVHIEAAAADAGLYVSGPVSTSISGTYIGGVVGQGYDSSLANVSSETMVDVDGKGNEYIGGIAGALTGTISGAKVTAKNITAVTTGETTNVAGICTGTATMRNCTVTMDKLSFKSNATASAAKTISLSGIGSGAIADCVVEIDIIKAESAATVSHGFQVGGISSGGGYNIERSRIHFGKIEVTAGYDTPYVSSNIGGIVSNIANTYKVSRCVVEGDGQIVVNLPKKGNGTSNSGTGNVYVGGLAGSGNVSHSSIQGALNISVTTGMSVTIYAGGLTGNGVAEYGSIGTADNHAVLSVVKTTTENDDFYSYFYNYIFIGGVSGYAAPSPTLPFQYNVSFCDVTLQTSLMASQALPVGGVAGSISTGADSVTECLAAGSVTLTNNYSGNETDEVIYAGGIAAMTSNAATLIISKCAALNGTLVIDGSNTAAGKTWRRIAYPSSNVASTKFVNNITNIPLPDGYSANLDAADKQDGLTVTEINEDTFFGTGEGQLGWNRAVWDWDAASGFPVLK